MLDVQDKTLLRGTVMDNILISRPVRTYSRAKKIYSSEDIIIVTMINHV